MKKSESGLAILGGITFLGVCLGTLFSLTNSKSVQKVDATTKPTTIDLNDTSESEIRSYYSYLDTLDESERRGTNLLKNLKYILVNNPSNTSKAARYFSYAQVREIYAITDRQWTASPASAISGYDSSTNTISGYGYSEDPYLYYYYRSDNFTNPQLSSATVTSSESKSQTLLNQEHLWSVSHGFKGDATAQPNAGSDLHHLVAGDVSVNKWGHSNYTYGYVATEDSGWVTTRSNWDNGTNSILGNKRGTAKTTHSSDESTTVFEPQDQDKGDIARALFYMAARYNYYGADSSSATQTEPNLEIIDYISDENTTITCDGTNGTGKYGILTDLLDWHKNDPVTKSTDTGYYEVHRNNLIYTNYQYTRNPFIDFPEWIDYIWGDKKDTGVASPATDTINGYNTSTKPTAITLNVTSKSMNAGDTFQASVSSVTPSGASKSVTWSSSDTSVATVTSSGSVQAVSSGSVTITATSTEDSNVKATIAITVSGVSVTGISLNKVSTTISEGSSETLSVTYTPSNASNKTCSWSSSNTSVATVSNGVVTAVSSGNATITATSNDGGYTATCSVSVTGSTGTAYYEKVTSASGLTSGDYIIACESASIAMNGGLDKTNLVATGNNISISDYLDVDNGKITSNSTTDAAKFTYDASAKTLKSNSGYYIGTNTTTSGVSASDTTAYVNDISFDSSGNAVIVSNSQSTMKLQVYKSSNFRFYSSTQTSIQLYKLTSQGGGGGETITKSYKLISDMASLESGNYVIASNNSGTYYAMSNSFPQTAGSVSASTVTVSNNEITVADATNYFVTLTVSDTAVTISNSSGYLSWSSSTNLIQSSSAYSWTVSVSDKGYGTFNFSGDSRYLAFSKSGSYFKSYASISSSYLNLELFKYTEEKTSYSKTDFANEMLNSITCDSTGVNAPTFASGYSWSVLKSHFSNLSSDDQTLLRSVSAVEGSSDAIESAMYRYDYIVGKYLISLGDTSYDDFIGRNPSPVSLSPSVNLNNSNSTFVPVIVLLSLVSFTSLLGYVYLKRKEQ